MLQCPICEEWKAKYHKSNTQALRVIIGRYPAVAESANDWLLMEDEPRFDPDWYEVEAAVQDVILIHVCIRCAAMIRNQLWLKDEDLVERDYVQCPCCGYYTNDYPDICSVCFWSWDRLCGATVRDDEKALRKAQTNYKKFGACDLKYVGVVRPPYRYEQPKYNA